ncbi:hypothetical protein GOBAR_AA19648 [Gossypium barbadense]|uniref:Uncharacterized protein n=1 Tax=Gossypium barbadense TaxID=3634 RepID=A0A2P5XCF7_GOSBA|nr:hypothetical protein GOBAR_AA19648 [Gossypium barbadense]
MAFLRVTISVPAKAIVAVSIHNICSGSSRAWVLDFDYAIQSNLPSNFCTAFGETWQPAQNQSLTFSGPGRKPHFPSPSRQQHWEKDDQDLTCWL